MANNFSVTNNFYYSCRGTYKKKYHFSPPEKVDLNKIHKLDSLLIIPNEIKNDEIIRSISREKIKFAEYNLKNIDILIKNNLFENELIKPLYLS